MRRISPIRVFLNRRPKEVPAGLWRQFVDRESTVQRAFGICVAVTMFGSTLMLFAGLGLIAEGLGLRLGISGRLRWVFWGAYLIGVTVSMLMYLPYSRTKREIWQAFIDRLIEFNKCICTECGYRLVGATERDVCPECGAAFDRAETMERWYELFPELGAAMAKDGHD